MKTARFVTITHTKRMFNQATFDRDTAIAGWKGYTSNLDAQIMDAVEVVASYHQLWHVEQSFRMSKTDLRARSIFHRARQVIEAHLTVVFAALAVARYLQTTTGISLKRIITTLRPLREFTGQIGDHEITLPPELIPEAQHILDQLNTENLNQDTRVVELSGARRTVNIIQFEQGDRLRPDATNYSQLSGPVMLSGLLPVLSR